MKTIISYSLFILCSLSSISAYAIDICPVTNDRGTSHDVLSYTYDDGATTVMLTGCEDLYTKDTDPDPDINNGHVCSTTDGQLLLGKDIDGNDDFNELGVCEIQNWIKLANWGANEDMVIVPHRGVWGYKADTDGSYLHEDGAPENSLAAILEAKQAGYNVVELDVVLARDDDTDSLDRTKRVIMFGHYFTLGGFTDYAGTQTDGTQHAVYNKHSSPPWDCPATPAQPAVPALPQGQNPICYNTGGTGYTWNTDPDTLLTLHNNYRDGTSSTNAAGNSNDGNCTADDPDDGICDTSTKYVTLKRSLRLIKKLGMVALIDPKTASGNTFHDGTEVFANIDKTTRNAEWLEIYALTIDLAESLGATANIVMKTANPLTYDEVEAVVGVADIHKILWSPQSSKAVVIKDYEHGKTATLPNGKKDYPILSEADSMHSVLYWIDGWAVAHEKDIAIWDSSIFSPLWWGGKEFKYDRAGSYSGHGAAWDGQQHVTTETGVQCTSGATCKTYDNLLGYLKDVSGKRAGLWQIEPGGRRGVMNSFNEWAMYATGVDEGREDYRGDFMVNDHYKWASHAGITTDREDVYRMIRDNASWFTP